MEGNDADLVMINTNTDWLVKKMICLQSYSWSAYEGMKLRGRPIATWLRGKLVYHNGKIVGNKNGKWLREKVNTMKKYYGLQTEMAVKISLFILSRYTSNLFML